MERRAGDVQSVSVSFDNAGRSSEPMPSQSQWSRQAVPPRTRELVLVEVFAAQTPIASDLVLADVAHLDIILHRLG